MTGLQRRGMMLTQVILLLPLIAAVLMIAGKLTSESMRLQGRERRLMADDAVIRDLARRIRCDAGRADRATVQRNDAGAELRLVSSDRTVVYHAADHRVTRTEQTDTGLASRYVWTLEFARADFSIETVGSSPGLVWTSFTTIAPVPRGPVPERRLATAAAVGRGAAS